MSAAAQNSKNEEEVVHDTDNAASDWQSVRRPEVKRSGPRVCRHYAAGHCAAGDRCTFSHILIDSISKLAPTQIQPCEFWMQGRCKYGDKCTKPHFVGTNEPKRANSQPREEFRTKPADTKRPSTPPDPFDPFAVAVRPPPASFAAAAAVNVPDSLKIATRSVNQQSRRLRSDEICNFALHGKCKFGAGACRLVHATAQCESCGLIVLDAFGNHITGKCAQTAAKLDNNECDEADIECGICMEKVVQKGRFGLLNCDHAFCVDCIRKWRSTAGADPQIIRACPLCRTITHFVTPSYHWVRDPQLKVETIENYRASLASKPCRYYDNGNGQCPFGSSCFYAHIGLDGRTEEAAKLRYLAGGDDETRIMSQLRLSDFIP